ncbi:germination protein YpeB [Paenibacillus sp. J2TS4]|uniref:germination protein YpeB n=1 Tax=Paenibacillus sp. J2TS4 TaxID=2807194 RepID=UPI001B2B201F|nr:germination protein YpeB [Paenibacillus sp. J2TS4]GIP32366.1 germination protein YpeB [Paenibacillus sp. J2TS4]
MYKRLSAVMFPILLVALIGTGVWGYQENREKNTVLIKAENQYQRAFHDLSTHMDKLHMELGNTLAVNSSSHDMYRKGLINVWRITSQAQNEISQLPLTLLPFNKTADFLDNISKFSYRTAVRDLSKQPLNQEESKALFTLYERSKEITNELRGVQDKIIANNLRWMDVEVAVASQDQKMDNVIVDGFQLVNQKVSEYPEVDWGPTMATVNQDKVFSALSGEEVNADEVKQRAVQFLGVQDDGSLQVMESGAGTESNTFSVSGVKPGSDREVHLDYTKKGGQLIWYMSPREVTEKTIDIRTARDSAMEFLDNHGFSTMAAVSVDEYANVASLTFANRINGVVVYPEKMVVEVAMDNGEVLGLHAADYILEQKTRDIPKPALTESQARESLNKQFEVSGARLCLIRNDVDDEVLSYEFTGKVNGSNYKIFINADTGTEEKVEPVRQQDVAAVQ